MKGGSEMAVSSGQNYRFLSQERLKQVLKLRELETKKLQEIDQMKSRFIAHISHEFRTSLAFILGSVQSMLAQESDAAQVYKNHQLICSNVQRLLILIDQLLDVSKPEVQNMPGELQKGDVVKMLRETLYQNSKTSECTSHIPVILPTAGATVENKLFGVETGADEPTTKTFQAGELSVRLKNLTEQQKRLRAICFRELILKPAAIAVYSREEKFLQIILVTMEKNLSDSNFDVGALSRAVAMSRMQLHRKFKSLTNQSPGDFIRMFRLNRAEILLKQNFGNVSEIAFNVGFNSLSYFTRCFRERYGKTPSEYIFQHRITIKPLNSRTL